jgi:hypothetical protein
LIVSLLEIVEISARDENSVGKHQSTTLGYVGVSQSSSLNYTLGEPSLPTWGITMRNLFVCSILAGLLPVLSLTAQDKKITPDMQKKSAQEAMKAAKVADATVVESPSLILASGLPEAKAKLLVANMEKVYVLARKALRYEAAPKDEPKMVIYAFGDVDVFRGYVRSVLKRSPDKDEFIAMDLKGDVPVIAVSAKRGETTPNYDQMVGKAITELLLSKRTLNAQIEGWMQEGFQKAVLSRIDPRVGAAEKAKIRTLVRPLAKGAPITVTIAEKAWGEPNADRDAVAMSIMEFLTFGSGGSKLGDVLQGMVPSDEVRDPSFLTSIKKVEFKEAPAKTAAGKEWKETNDAAYLERAWRDWVSKGSPTVLK